MQLYLQPGHKIGKPAPLFTKIEQDRLNELKKRYGGAAQENATSTPANTPQSVADAEAAVAKQGDKVRSLKAAKAEKDIVQQEVKVLLALKSELEKLKSKQNASNPSVNAAAVQSESRVDTTKCAELEKAIAQQGDKVRDLKKSAEKSVWQPEVEKLLALKRELAQISGQPQQPPTKSGKKGK